MRYCILITLLTISSYSFSQKQVKDSNTNKSVKSVDTTKLLPEDSIVITDKDLAKSDLKIYLQQPSGKPDYFKYIFPIVTLIIGVVINKFLELITERKRIKKVGERWAAEIRCLEKPISNQIVALENFLNEHRQEKYFIPQMYIYSGLDCEIFKTLDKSDLLKFFEKKKKKKYRDAVLSSNKIHGFISVITSLFDSLKTKFQLYLDRTSAYSTTLTQNLQSLQEAYFAYGVLIEKETNNDPLNDERFKPISDLFVSQIFPYSKQGNYDIYKLESEFFKPLIEQITPLRLDERTNELTKYYSGCLNAIKGIKMEKGYLNKNFEQIISRYKNELAELENVAKEVEV